jgi:hypothetical protein
MLLTVQQLPIFSHRVVRRRDELQNDDEADEHGLAVDEPEGRVQRLQLVQVREEGEHHEDVHLELIL